ncbi:MULTISPECIES: hypothetical protein [unclassified Bacillus cereus group]|uniref:hypothetical protein n=1 Tax=unclassified Bacillus cereus group TaxID=2750818 RepID=UPI001F586E3F|nr:MULTISPECIES: hypothetical protein [unclassified Bacillus cereus group]
MDYIILMVILGTGMLLIHIGDKKDKNTIVGIGLVLSVPSGIILFAYLVTAPFSTAKEAREKLNGDREISISKKLNIPKEQIRFESEGKDSMNAVSLKGDYYVQFKQETATIVKIESLKNKSEKG